MSVLNIFVNLNLTRGADIVMLLLLLFYFSLYTKIYYYYILKILF